MSADAIPMTSIFYSCPECGIGSKELRVPARTDKDNPATIKVWIDGTVINAITIDHTMTSPECKAKTVGIILPGDVEFIGAATPPKGTQCPTAEIFKHN